VGTQARFVASDIPVLGGGGSSVRIFVACMVHTGNGCSKGKQNHPMAWGGGKSNQLTGARLLKKEGLYLEAVSTVSISSCF